MAVRMGGGVRARRLVVGFVSLALLSMLLRTPLIPYRDAWRGHPPFRPGQAPERQIDNTNPRSRLPKSYSKHLEWNPPVEIEEHYPPYDQYEQRDYDPNRWEAFPQNNAIYTNGTLNNLAPGTETPTIYLPYPQYNSQAWRDEWHGDFVPCDGPRGRPLNDSPDDLISAYLSRPTGYPYPDVGSWEAVGLHENICFDRAGRLGPYGLDTTGLNVKAHSRVDWEKVRWGKLQDECMLRNNARFANSAVASIKPGKDEPEDSGTLHERPGASTQGASGAKKHRSRTAILIRTWDSYKYEENDMQTVRSLITEASLLSGGEYQVFLFVNIKSNDLPIFTDKEAYEKALRDYVPEEFRDIAILWSEQVCKEWYSKVGEWGVYWQQFMPLQWFSKTHDEFDFIWNWEMDARLIGQHFHFLDKMANFSLHQPRKFLWERNARFYLPQVHGSYRQYVANTNSVVASAKAEGMMTVWGPQRWSESQTVIGQSPPTTEDQDNFQWGVGEEADFITLLPLWDPRETFWSYRDKMYNYPWGPGSYDERPYPHVPRRVFINTLARFSKKLLHAMHMENKAGLSMASEMWPGSVALQHGLKAVYAPHPIWQAQIWPADYMEGIFNADGWGAGGLPGGTTDDGRGRGYDRAADLAGKPQFRSGPNGEGLPARWSQERDAPYSPDREHNFGGWSWYFWSDFPKVIYWRWLGWRAGFSIATIKGVDVTDELGIVGGGKFEREHGRMCLPSMLMHPVKNVKPPKDPAPAVPVIEEHKEPIEQPQPR